MLFACCHPALAPEARMALTLRSVAGLTVPEIARAFLSSEVAMERRLGRARRKVTDARIPVSVPSDDLLPERLAGVLRVVYLIFTEGHAGPVRGDLCEEAIRLARLLVRLMPDESEARGLLALLLLTDARRAARMADGELVALPEQDRSLWDARADRGGPGADRRAARPVRDPGRDLRAPLDRAVLGGDGLAADRGAVRRAAALRRLAGRGGQPRGGGRLRRRAAGGAGAARRGGGRRAARALPAAARRPGGAAARAGEDADEAYARAIEPTDNEAERRRWKVRRTAAGRS